ncbi:MAG: sigma-70 family RNA polymerase sigma factor [Planctomycetes bacterium]|nr:sigma-70 family RNA polymerase sigma factor [Planctomycetota bacterium]
MAEAKSNVTVLLDRIKSGDEAATNELMSVAYDELRAIAGHVFRDQGAGHTLQPTALVSELCVRLLRSQEVGNAAEWNDRKHFFRVAAKAMRNLLTDHARAKRAERRGGEGVKVTLDGAREPAAASPIDLVELDDTVTKLAALDERLGRVFELRFLAGLSVERTAEIADVSPRTVEMDTRFIRAWLQKELSR